MIWKSPLSHLERCRRLYGDRFTLHNTSKPPLVFICDPQEIRAVLTAPADVLHPGEGARVVQPVVGAESFMLHDGSEHLNGRRTILPALRASEVARNADTIRDVTERGLASWPRETPFAAHPHIRALMLESALRTVLGVSDRAADPRVMELHRKLLAMLTVAGSTTLPEPLLRHGPGKTTWRRFLEERAELDTLLYDIIEHRDRSRAAAGNALDRLLAARNTDGSPLSPMQVRDNFMSLVLAGHETTASQLAWAFQLLAHHPDVVHGLQDEIDADSGEEYLTATISEIVRHRPVFLFAIPREVKQHVTIGGWTYRPSAQLLACTYLLHHNPRLYPEPDRFLPERFLSDTAHREGEAWRPWGGGRRRCPGLHLASLDMKTVLRTVLATNVLRPAAKDIEQARWRTAIVTPAAGSRVVLQARRGYS
jgi:cytochrome P450